VVGDGGRRAALCVGVGGYKAPACGRRRVVARAAQRSAAKGWGGGKWGCAAKGETQTTLRGPALEICGLAPCKIGSQSFGTQMVQQRIATCPDGGVVPLFFRQITFRA